MARVLICVTHLLGTGHLSRALTLGRAFAQSEHDVHVMSGGMPAPNLSREGITFHQMPALKSDGVNFTTLLTEDGPADEAFLEQRKQASLKVLQTVQPDVVITELYPFGRRVLKGEFLSVLNAARELPNPPLVYCSIRDILAPPSKPKKALETDAVITAYYDGILVHSDPAVTPLDASWPVSDMTGDKVIYTGYVAPPAPTDHPDGVGQGEVLVTAGGGDVGMPLFRTAIRAAAQDTGTTWRILVGGSEKAQSIKALQSDVQSKNVIIEGTRPDFRQMLVGAKATICMCGYNTAMDVLQTQTPAVFVPFDAGGEVEQTLRAQSLAQHAGFAMVKAHEASEAALIAALRQVCRTPMAEIDTGQFQGATKAVEIIEAALERKR